MSEERKRRILSLDNQEPETEVVEQDRAPREAESREVEQRPSDAWLPSSALPTPRPEEGWEFRWIRTSQLGSSDNINVSKKLREGWIPVKAEDYAYMNLMTDIDSNFADNLEVGGLLLCKMPTERIQARKKYMADMAAQQIEGVDNSFLKENDPRMPLLQPERKSRTTFGRG